MPKTGDGQQTNQARDAKLGTFAGVFTPSILTILGIILFLRLGFVIGQAGIGRALAIILMANVISILTSVSLSAIATNLRVKGGGDYYVISRTLGVEFGGALGLVLYLAQSVSIAFYAIGFGEAVAVFLPGRPGWLPQAIAAGAVGVLFVLAWLGSDWATRFQFVVMVVLFIAIAGFFAGGIPLWDAEQFSGNLAPAGSLRFWTLFAIFFPAVTGFTQGVSMSGDLRDPVKSLPLGTFAAVFLSLAVYIGVAVVFAGAVPGQELASDYGVMRRVAVLPWLVDAGVIAATLSSALASFMGAPRILQSLAADRVFRLLNPFAAGHGPTNNPRRGLLLSAAIALATVALGELNVIAPVVSMFFLISYGLLNYATYIEARANSPYFRPRFRFYHKNWSLLGGLACLGAMLAISPLAGVAAVLLLFAIYQFVARTVSVERWADSEPSNRFQRMRKDLFAISRDPVHPRDWRPVILAFSEEPARRLRLLRFAEWLEGRSGFTTAIQLIEGGGPRVRKVQQEAEEALRTEINQQKLPAFAKVIVTPNLETALPDVIQSHGLGRVRANTALFNMRSTGDPLSAAARARALRTFLRFGVSLVALSTRSDDFEAIEASKDRRRTIDVWYRDNASGRMMLMLAYLMTRSQAWADASLRVFVKREGDAGAEETRDEFTARLDDYRIAAEPVAVTALDTATVLKHSSETSVVFLPFRVSFGGPRLELDAGASELTTRIPIAVLVLAAEDLQLDVEPDEGRHGEIAEAIDAAARAKADQSQIEKEAGRAENEVEKVARELERAEEGGMEPQELDALRKASDDARKRLKKARRRVARGRAKVDKAVEEAETLAGKPIEKKAGPKG